MSYKKLNELGDMLLLAILALTAWSITMLPSKCEAAPVTADLYSQYHRMGEVTIDVPDGTEAAWCYSREVPVQQQDNGRWLTGTEVWCKLYDSDEVKWELQYRNFPEENKI